jgi:hypothetical protein
LILLNGTVVAPFGFRGKPRNDREMLRGEYVCMAIALESDTAHSLVAYCWRFLLEKKSYSPDSKVRSKKLIKT